LQRHIFFLENIYMINRYGEEQQEAREEGSRDV